MQTSLPDPSQSPRLIRGIGLGSAIGLNMTDMIGVGPFITMPLMLSAMGGPQAMLGWIVGAFFAVCDGLVWAELGAAWQLSFSAPLSIATGCIGLAGYAAFYWPQLGTIYASHTLALHIPWAGLLQVSWIVTPGTAVAIAVCVLAMILLYRKITAVGKLMGILWICVLATVAWIVFAGLTHFNAAQAFDSPPGAFTLSRKFFIGLGGAMLISTYDYWGYYNVCFLGDEIKDPGRNIPRALLLSIAMVAFIYLVMNICIFAVVPWREILRNGESNGGLYVLSLFMQKIYGAWAARTVTALVMLTAFASVFSLMLGYSRVPYAAARDGNYFKFFAKVHPEYRIPHVSLVVLSIVAAGFCFLRLKDAIAALVVIRILLQFIVQAVGVMVLRVRQPGLPRPFRMWLYPLPALLAIAGFLFVLFNRQNAMKEVRYAAVILLAGLAIYSLRAWRAREWPFHPSSALAIDENPHP
jgi:amino acid transporter